ncbi:FUSC family protein [Rothia aerolata]|uniref:Integral membrane bound transporter domain-containing protein n=1 Tax=Rothia aerolata TaxID=1812262 RepID=A0A917IT73_9MICC|nr:FUSC family protein [Rothia aerolata]GGH62061.1 hypothetical protein GCM10007359_11900 [Rothia aerolata]
MADTWTLLKTRAKNRFTTGMARVREGFVQSLQIVVAGVGAYAFALHVLGHHEPIFAATAAIVSLGFVRGSTHSRRMLEVTLGVTLGILIGDVLMLLLGRGLWQAAVVLLISVLTARFLDKGILFSIQMGLQSCLVVLMEPTGDGVFARSLDGVVGGLFAFLMMFLFPKDPRVTPRLNAHKLMQAYSSTLGESATAMRAYESDLGLAALESARKLDPLYSAASGDIVTAKGMAQISVLGKSHMTELTEFSETLHAVDLAIRNTRMLNRRMASTISHVQLSRPAIDAIADTLHEISLAVTILGDAMSSSDADTRAALKKKAASDLERIAGTLDPALMGVRTLEGESLVLMIRPLVIDLLEACGLTHAQATEVIIPLGESMTEHAPRTNQISLVEQQPRRVVLSEDLSTKEPLCENEDDAEDLDGLAPDDTRALNIVLRAQHLKD